MKLTKILALLSVFAFSSVQAAPIVLGTATLNSADDLTQIQLDSGDVIEWLDISSSRGMDIATALTNFSGFGFQVATLNDMQNLLDAFGLPTVTSVFPMAGSETFASTAAIVANFTSFLGTTFNGENATGWLDDELVNGQAAVLNVRGSGSDVFVNNFNGGSGDNGGASTDGGVWLFRTARDPGTPIPEPTSIALLGLGLMLLGRRAKA